jgi:transglutaminase-like putative cysteine protease
MNLEVGCRLGYQCVGPANFMLTIQPYTGRGQKVLQETFQTNPDLYLEATQDTFGNRSVRLQPTGGNMLITYRALVSTSPPASAIEPLPWSASERTSSPFPTEVLPFLSPSFYCPSHRLTSLTEQLLGDLASNSSSWNQVKVSRLCDWIYDNIEYRYGTSDVNTSAHDTLIQRTGVCRDFAHVGITFCRALGIPARFVAGYALALDPPDFHACFEAYVDGQWHLFDPTRKAAKEHLIPIAVGYDAANTPFAQWYGEAEMNYLEVWSHQVPEVVVPLELMPEPEQVA